MGSHGPGRASSRSQTRGGLTEARPSASTRWGALGSAATLLLLAGLVVVAAAHAAPAGRAASPTASSPIAFVRGDHVWTISPDGSGPRRLTSGSSTDEVPAWSPDHGTVYFARSKNLGQDATLYSVPASGGTPAVVYKDVLPHGDWVEITGIAADPAGGRVVIADVSIASSANLPVCRLVSVDLATGAPTVLLRRVGGFGHVIVVAWHVTWSPDGKELLVSQAGQDAEGGQTWFFTLADRSVRKLGVPNAANADWSPDGSSVLVSIDGQAHTSVKLVHGDGSAIRTLATGGGWGGPPAVYGARFSGDGAQVAYVRGLNQLWLMNADGSGRHELTKGIEPAWR